MADHLRDATKKVDFISREAAMAMPLANGQYDHEHANEHFILGLESYKEWLEYVPAADVKPVVRAYWLEVEEPWGHHTTDFRVRCSNCLKEQNHPTAFCPNCGADCRGGNDGK